MSWNVISGEIQHKKSDESSKKGYRMLQDEGQANGTLQRAKSYLPSFYLYICQVQMVCSETLVMHEQTYKHHICIDDTDSDKSNNNNVLSA